MKRVLSFSMMLLFMITCYAQEQEVTIKSTNVRNNIYMLEGQGGNMGLIIGDDGAILIDDQFARLSDKIKAAIAEITDKPVRFVINTHLHGDHSGGNENFAQTGSIIVAHENVRTRLSTEQFNKSRNQTTPPRPKDAWPVVTFTESMNLHFNNEDIQIIHTKNGHTDGDSFIYFKNANVIHTGDALRTGGFPYVDVSSGGTFQGLIDSTDQLANLCNEETAVIQGHGSLSTKEEVIWVRDRLQSIKDILQAGIAEGKTADDLVNEKVLKDFADWDGGFIKSKDFITIVYDELAAQ
jgi:glyoxylase-like metal-dependent hydrolase (beta-lactamase superfamily II)